MATFTDLAGNAWRVDINLATWIDTRKDNGVDLSRWLDGRLQRHLSDPATFVDVLFCVCGDEARARGVGPVQFAQGLADVAVYEAAYAALVDAIAEFEPPDRRGLLRKMLTKVRAVA